MTTRCSFTRSISLALAGKDLRERPLHLQEQSRAAVGATDSVEMEVRDASTAPGKPEM
jgi:hypothetical protein